MAGFLALAIPIPIDADEESVDPGPAAITRALLDAAVVPLNERDLNAAYRFRTRFVQGKPGGDVLEERVEVWAIEQQGPSPGPGRGRLLSSELDGEDVTDARRAEVAEQRREPEEADDADSEGDTESDSGFADIVNLRLPGAEDGDIYVFRSEPRDGDTCAARFEPPAGEKIPDRAARGVLSWNCETREPVRLEAERVEAPMLVDAVAVEWDFGIIDGIAFTQRYRLVVEGGLPFLKRRYEFAATTESFSVFADLPSN